MDFDVSIFKFARGAVAIRQPDSKAVCGRVVVGHIQLERAIVPVDFSSAKDAPRIRSLLKICGDAGAPHAEGTFKAVVNVNNFTSQRAVFVFVTLESSLKFELRLVAGWPGDVSVAGGEILALLTTAAATTAACATAATAGACSRDRVTILRHSTRERKDPAADTGASRDCVADERENASRKDGVGAKSGRAADLPEHIPTRRAIGQDNRGVARGRECAPHLEN